MVPANDTALSLFEAPAPDFDPSSASDDVLKRFGILPRPTLDASSQYKELWNRIFASEMTYIVPRFTPRTVRRQVSRGALNIGTAGVQYTSWAGMGVKTIDAPTAMIAGSWVVPNLNVPPYVPDNVWCINSAWIGIDGFVPPANSILQAGVDLCVLRSGGVVTVKIAPWWEWYPGVSFYLDNFPVSPGDTLSCCISSAPGSAAAIVHLANLVNFNRTTQQVPAPSGTTLVGTCAEWIVERQFADADSSVLTELSNFGTIFFEDAFCSTAISGNGTQRYPGQGIPMTMVADDQSTVLAIPTALGLTSFKVDRE